MIGAALGLWLLAAPPGWCQDALAHAPASSDPVEEPAASPPVPVSPTGARPTVDPSPTAPPAADGAVADGAVAEGAVAEGAVAEGAVADDAAASPSGTVDGEALQRVEALEAVLPADLAFVQRASEVARADADPQRAERILLEGVALACRRQAGPDADELRREVEAVLEDPAFVGQRQQPDLIDRWMAELQAFLFELLESEGMQKYASSSRVIYLAVLGSLGLWTALRLWRARRARVRRGAGPSVDDGVERERERVAQDYLDDARRCLVDGEAVAAVHLALLGLLARLGEEEADAVRPSRTNREILAGLGPKTREVVEEPLRRYEAHIYAERLSSEEARSYVELVASLVARWSAP